ncbi:restriction endonuclease subunit S [Solobacterium moorei]|uniref:restriction endonuclease subunit S n=1 Tax=Solobacterium moorei TaxID=102148 RepID=UPI0024ADE8F3|nr:restriction endonuclease subunit S [Solobacterium moorei]MDI6414856.1 restriction endonuclease subunit S [Solobacterium moorei]
MLDLVICPEVLTDAEWGEFFLGDIFTIDTKSSRGLNHLNRNEKNGVSYVGATNRNNGVLDFVEEDLKMQYKGNCIAFIRNCEGSMGYSIYKKESFIATQDISVGYNEKLNEYSAKFITTIADRVRGKYTFGYKRNQTRLKKEILTLPIDENGDPNWAYMENFIKSIEQKQIKNVLKYLDQYI